MLLLIFLFDLCYSRGTTWSNYPELCGSFDELGTLLGIEPHKVQFSSVELGTLLPSLSPYITIHVSQMDYISGLQAEKIASKMIYEDRMRGSIDQV